MMYHFFNIGTYSPRSTKVLLRYVVMYVKIYIWSKLDLGTPGESICSCKFVQILFQIPKIMFPFFFKNISYMHGYMQLVLKKYYAIYKRPQSTFGIFCQFYTFLMLNPHRIQLSAMRNLAPFKEPAL